MIETKKQKLKRLRREFNEKCLSRDMRTCVMCGRQDVKLSVHHIVDRHLLPNDGYTVSNGITLCDGEKSCHWKAEQWHISNGVAFVPNYHPNDLFKKINSSDERAMEDSRLL